MGDLSHFHRQRMPVQVIESFLTEKGHAILSTRRRRRVANYETKIESSAVERQHKAQGRGRRSIIRDDSNIETGRFE